MKRGLLSAMALISGLSASAQLADGSFAEDFTVTAYQPGLASAGMNSNGSYNLYDYLDAGYTVFFDVSATWCGPCWNYHNSGALEELYYNHGPAGQPGVSPTTTDDVMVIWIDGDPQTADATMLDGSGAIGNWINPSGSEEITFPMANPVSATATQINNDYEIAYFPTIYKICPNRIVSEIGQANAAALYAGVTSCPPPATLATDVAAFDYTGTPYHCEGSYTPKVKIQNYGTGALTSATVTISVGGSTVSTGTFSGNLATYELAEVTCTAIASYTPGTLDITVTTTGDGSAANNTLSEVVASVPQVTDVVYLTLKTDFWSEETEWVIETAAGATVPGTANPALANDTQYDLTYTLPATGCYVFNISDSYGDGILNGPTVSGDATGMINFRDADGTVIMNWIDYGYGAEVPFKVTQQVAGIEEASTIGMEVFPNPATTSVNVKFEATGGDYNVNITDLSGRVVGAETIANATGAQKVEMSLAGLASGNYLITVSTEGATYTQRFVVK